MLELLTGARIIPPVITPVNDRRYVFHFRPKPNIWPEKHLALGQIPKPNVIIYVEIGDFALLPLIIYIGNIFVNKK